MEGCRVYRHRSPPIPWRERLDIAKRLVSSCAPESPPPSVVARGRGLDDLTRLAESGVAATEAMSWGYLSPTQRQVASARARAWMEGGATVYLSLDRYDERDQLTAGARAYGNPEIGKSTLMLTLPAQSRADAGRLLAAMLGAARSAGLLPGEEFDPEALAASLLGETRDVLTVAGVEVRPTRIGDYPHMFRLTHGQLLAATVLATLEPIVAAGLGVPGRVYLKLQGPVAAVASQEGLDFPEGLRWRVRAPLPPGPVLDALLSRLPSLSVVYHGVRWRGQPESPLHEVTVGISNAFLGVTVGFEADGGAVEAELLAACPDLERGADMPLE
jgi:hypothetical protein